MLTVQGVDNGAVMVLNPLESDTFILENVPVIEDPDLFAQHVTMIYSNENCNRGVMYDVPTAPVVNGSVDITLNFVDANCIGNSTGHLVPRALTWKYDGSTIFFRMLGYKRIPAGYSTNFGWTNIEPDGGALSSGHT